MEKALGMIGGGPNIDVAISAAGGEVLVLELGQVENLNDGLRVGQFKNVQLVLLMETVHNEVAFAKGGNEEIAALTTDSH